MWKCQCLLFVLKQSFICDYIICMTVPLNKNALHQIYNIIVGTIDAMEYLVYYFGLLTLKSNFFSYLLATM